MRNLTGKQPSGKRLVLGYDGRCSACGELARRIEEQLAGRLEVRNLRDPLVKEWRKKTLGEGAPLAPTLFEVRKDRDREEVGRGPAGGWEPTWAAFWVPPTPGG